MINLNSGKEIIRVEKWEDIESYPGFKTDIDPKKIKLKEIIGDYEFDYFIPCGLSSCHQPHGRGYLVEAMDGTVTNIGLDCGKTHFDVEFDQLRRVFDKLIRDRSRRERIKEVQNKYPNLQELIEGLVDGQYGIKWIRKKKTEMFHRLPSYLSGQVRDMAKNRTSTLVKVRRSNDQERELGASETIDEAVGRLDGINILYHEDESLRQLFVIELGVELPDISDLDADAIEGDELRLIAKKLDGIEEKISRATEIVENGRRFFRRTNIVQLSLVAKKAKDKRFVEKFSKELP